MAEVLVGKDKNEQLVVSADKTQAYGLSGNDTLISDNKSEVLLIGGSGDDRLIMTGGVGTLNGGKGNDTFEFTYSKDKKISAVIEDLDPSSDKIVVNFDGNAKPQLSSVVSGNDVVWSDSEGLFKLTLKGVRENDYFDGNADEEIWEVLKITNDEREKANLPALTLSEGLMTGAAIRAKEIINLAESGVLNNHDRPDGKGKYYTVLVDKDLNLSLSNKYSGYAENLQAGAESPSKVMEEWMNSETHNKNILDNQDKEKIHSKKLGVGYVYADSLTHEYYWTQLFADSLQLPETVSTNELLTASIQGDKVKKYISGNDHSNRIDNDKYGATIEAKGGNDFINNTGAIVSISGGNGNDKITNSGANVTINAGEGNDQINLQIGARENLIEYRAGDGSDIIRGFDETDTLSISDSEYTPVTVGNNVVVAVGNDSITLEGAAKSGIKILGTKSNLIIGTDDNDLIESTLDSATINALDGDDTITNSGSNVTINAGAGNDSINNGGDNVLFVYDGGDDTIEGLNSTSTLKVSESTATSLLSDNDIILHLRTGKITLAGVSDAKLKILDANNRPVEIGDAKKVDGTENSDNLSKDIDYATIQALGGNDTITNSGNNVSINGGDGKDLIESNGKKTTIMGGTGNDNISLGSGAKANLIEYRAGDGNDVIYGFKNNSTLSIGDGFDTYSTQVIDNDIIITVGEDSISLVGAASLESPNIEGKGDNSSDDTPGETISNSTSDTLITGSAGNDTITNTGKNVTIDALAGNDSLTNYGANVTIIGGNGNDYIYNDYGDSDSDSNSDANSTSDANATSDSDSINDNTADDTTSGANVGVNIDNTLSNTLITGTSANDSIDNYYGERVTIDGGAGNDSINNWGASSKLYGGAGNDSITNSSGVNSTINGGTGNDYVYNAGGDLVSINGGEGSDTVWNNSDSVTINGGTGNDSLRSYTGPTGANVTINGDSGDDTISFGFYDSSVKVNGGEGDDLISLGSNGSKNVVEYNSGDGDDSIWGFNSLDTLIISGGSYSTTTSNSNIIVTVGDNSILLVNRASLETVNIISVEDTTSGDTVGVTINNTLSNTLITGTSGNDTINNGCLWDDTWHDGGSNVTINGSGGDDSINNDGGNSSISGGDGDDHIYSNGNYNTIEGGNGSDTIQNAYDYVTIEGGAGNDSIWNGNSLSGRNSSVSGGAGDDKIHNYGGENSTISGGAGNDTIYNNYNVEKNILYSDSYGEGDNVLFEYTTGDGNDVIYGFKANSTLSITGGSYSTATSGSDIIVTVGDGSITLKNAASLESVNIVGAEDTTSGDTVGKFISNTSSNTLITSTSGNDTIYNEGDSVTIDSGAGYDSIYSSGSNVSIKGGSDGDTIHNEVFGSGYAGSNNTIDGGAGNDFISSDGAKALIFAGTNDDTILNYGNDATINAGNGNDSIFNQRSDTDDNSNVSIFGGAGNDEITNNGGSNATILGGTGNDQISLSSDAVNNFIQYAAGDGNDVIKGFRADSTLSISGGSYSTQASGSDIIVTVGDGSITLKGAASLETVNIVSAEDTTSDDTLDNTNIEGGKGNDTINNRRANTTIKGGAGEDSIENYGNDVSINGGTGNDDIHL